MVSWCDQQMRDSGRVVGHSEVMLGRFLAESQIDVAKSSSHPQILDRDKLVMNSTNRQRLRVIMLSFAPPRLTTPAARRTQF